MYICLEDSPVLGFQITYQFYYFYLEFSPMTPSYLLTLDHPIPDLLLSTSISFPFFAFFPLNCILFY